MQIYNNFLISTLPTVELFSWGLRGESLPYLVPTMFFIPPNAMDARFWLAVPPNLSLVTQNKTRSKLRGGFGGCNQPPIKTSTVVILLSYMYEVPFIFSRSAAGLPLSCCHTSCPIIGKVTPILWGYICKCIQILKHIYKMKINVKYWQ